MNDHVRQRLAEILPGALVWATILFSVALSFIRPLWVIYGVILFDLYWLFRIMYYLPFLLVSWWRYRKALRTDWQALVFHCPGVERIHHLVFLPTVNEPVHVIRETLRQIASSAYPSDRMTIVLACEGRVREHVEQDIVPLAAEFRSRFSRILITVHPPDLADEIVGKGSNLHWSGNQVLPQLIAADLSPDDVIVSSFDVDTIIHPQYFSCLTYRYLTTPNPTRHSYQPVPLYNNNLWVSPAVIRVAMFGTTFWLMTELSRPEHMMTFSSHSMSLRMLMDVGWWQKDIVSEDSRIFLQGLVRYHGDYHVAPIYLPVSMDTVMTGKYWPALVALYKQLRRWAWGVENFPYMVKSFRADSQMPLRVKVAYIWKQLEGMYTWATAPILIFLMGRLPFLVAPESIREFAVFQNTPFTLQWIMRFAMIGVFVSAALALTMLPPRPAHVPRHQMLVIAVFQWLLLPLTFIVFGAIPAIDAQTRLMLGRPLGFTVSPKRAARA